MAHIIGLSQKLKLTWLNKSVDLLLEDLSEKDYKKFLTDYLSYEIESPTTLRKTCRNLMLVWFYEDGFRTNEIQELAASLIRKHPEDAVAVHWCMLMLTFPVFHDVCHIIGRMSDFDDIISLRKLKQKLYDEWGEKETLCKSAEKIIHIMKDMNAVETERPGNYRVVSHNVTNDDITALMLKAAMLSGGRDYYNANDLSALEVLFPFQYKVKRENFMNDAAFSVSNFGGELTVTVNGI